MHEEESLSLDRCTECDAVVDRDVDRAFAFGEDGLLCWQCAERRGGVYDEPDDHWVTLPDLSGLESRVTPPI